MKLRIVTWGAMVILGVLLYFNAFDPLQEVLAIIMQAGLIAINTYLVFKTDSSQRFDGDDILDC